jgi:hypothetical protein
MKQKHILLFSDDRRSAADLPLPPGHRYRLTYCGGDNHSVSNAIERSQRRYDWILIDGAALSGDQTEFFQSLRAIGFLLSGGCVDSPCKVEWDANGVLQLRCRKMNAVLAAAGGSPGAAYEGDEGFVFEYHAPMESTG